MDLVAGAGGPEAAVGAGDYALAADHDGIAHDALRHELRMLDQVDAVRHTPGISIFSSGSLTVLPDLPFVLVARVGGLDQIGAAR